MNDIYACEVLIDSNEMLYWYVLSWRNCKVGIERQITVLISSVSFSDFRLEHTF